MSLKKVITALLFIASIQLSWAQNFYSITGNSATYSNANSRDNIHELPNGNVVKAVQLDNVTPASGNNHDGILIMVLNPSTGNVLFSKRLFYDDIANGGGLVDLKLQNSCLDADGNIYIATLFRANPAPTINNVGNDLNKSTAVFKLEFDAVSNSYSYNNWIVYTMHDAYGPNQLTRYPRKSRVAYIRSQDLIFHVVSVSPPNLSTTASTHDDCQHLVTNLYDPITGVSGSQPQQNVIALTDQIGSLLFDLITIGEMKGDLYIAGNEKVYLDPLNPFLNNQMPAVLKLTMNNLEVVDRAAIRSHATFLNGIGSATTIEWLEHPSQQVFVMGYHGMNAHTGISIVDINLNPVLSKEIMMPNFFETYPYSIDYNYANDMVEITCQSDVGMGRLTLDPNASFADMNYWTAENTSMTPDGTVMLGSNWYASAFIGNYIETLFNSGYCYTGQNINRAVQNFTSVKYLFSLSQSYYGNGTGDTHSKKGYGIGLADVGLTPLTGERFTCATGSGNLVSAQLYRKSFEGTILDEEALDATPEVSKIDVYDLTGRRVYSGNTYTNNQALELQVKKVYPNTGVFIVVKQLEDGSQLTDKLLVH